MEFKTLLYQKVTSVLTITLNRPEVYNAIDDTLSYELQDALKAAKKDKDVRVIVLTGSGKAFCSGQDLKAISGIEKRSFIDSINKRYNPIIREMRNMPKPIICRLNGVAAGAGCSLALACDVMIAAETAILVEAFINIGLVLDSGSSYFLPRLLGSTRAFEMATMAPKITGLQAFEWGIANRAVPAEKLDEEVAKFSDYYANAPTKAIGLMKKMLNRSISSDFETVIDYEAYCQEIAGNSSDNKEGVQAFIEKRKPNFKGE
ncbi:MAG: enoyl-CoA hydratase/isomerase family protein [Flavobacteriales bacterium]|nr:enoyl-CoA hydratase/isomerase family protein [Flavobacteriales bacterium]